MIIPLSGSSIKAKRLFHQMAILKIDEKDLREEFMASPGPGGQHVNKVATCVVLRHLPTGRMVKCHQYRTQFANRIRARELLVDLFEKTARQEWNALMCHRAKKRAQQRGRSRVGKEKMLKEKKQRSDKKLMRKRPAIIRGYDD